MKKLLAKIRKILKDRRTRQLLTRIISITAAIVVFVTTYALVLPAITMESEANCGIPAHQHDDSCYKDRLICGQVESPGHHHTDACYSISKELICTEEEHHHEGSCFDADGNLTCEKDGHAHDDSCYEEVRELVCNIPESDGHEHTADCYERVLTCGMEAHTHSTACYSHGSELTASAPVDFTAVATTELGSYGATVSASIDAEADLEENAKTGASDASAAGGISSAVESTTGATTPDQTSAATAAGTASTGLDTSATEDVFIPQLEPIIFEQLLTKDTDIYYYHAEEGEEAPESSADIANWKRVNDNTELTPADLLRVYLRYTIPAGTLNATNDIARYRLPSNLHLTDQQMETINTTVNGVANQYVSLDTLEITDTEKYNTYLGIEATEGTRIPSDDVDEYFANHPDLEGQEYINAVVRAENVFDDTTGEYVGQDLVFTFSPYTVQKNQHEYDADGQPTKAGQKVDGWLCFDLYMDQIDWSEPVVSTTDDSAESTLDDAAPALDESAEEGALEIDEGSTESSANSETTTSTTVTERKESTAKILFADKDMALDISEISTSLRLVELSAIESEKDDNQEDQSQSVDNSVGSDESKTIDHDTAEDSTTEEETRDSESADEAETTEDDKLEPAVDINAETYPAVSFEDTITVQAGTLSTDSASAVQSTPAETTITVSVVAEEETFPLGTTMQLGTVEDMDTVASAVEGAVEGQTRGFHAVDISFYNVDGEEIEPLKPIKVNMTSEAIKQAVEDSSTVPVVVHVENPADAATTDNADTASATADPEATDSASKDVAETDAVSNKADSATDMTGPESASYAEDNTSADGSPADNSVRYGTPSRAESTTSAPTATIVETSETTSTENSADKKDTADTLSFDAGSFSVYAIVYTVDFEYSVNGKTYQFSLPGGGFVSFTDLVEVLGIIGNTNSDENENGKTVEIEDTEEKDANGMLDVTASDKAKKFVADVESVKFSSPELVDVSKVESRSTVGQIKEARGLECKYSAELTKKQIEEINAHTIEAGDWALISVQPFLSNETLTVTMKNGATFTIRVTDGQIKKTVISASGETYEVIVTYGEDAQIPDSAELRVKEILKKDKAYTELQKRAGEELSEKLENAIPSHPVLFDIAIYDGKTEIEPAEGSSVQVEIRLVKGSVTGTYTDQSSPLLINDEPVNADEQEITQKLQIIHDVKEESLEVVDVKETATEEKVIGQFETTSFSNWLLFLDEDLTDITVYKGDSITLRPYGEWYWKKNGEPAEIQALEWTFPNNEYNVTQGWRNNIPIDYNGNTRNYYGITQATTKDGKYTINGYAKYDRELHEEYWYYHAPNLQPGEFTLHVGNSRTIRVHVIDETGHVDDKPATVSGVNNIAVNLFDYDLGGTLDVGHTWQGDNHNLANDSNFNNTTINNGKTLKFLSSGSGNVGGSGYRYNDYYSENVHPGMVKNSLVKGYPELTNGSNLGYLFNTSQTTWLDGDKMIAYPNVTGLFQQNAEGYYYFNSNINYAYYNPANGNKQVTLYEHTYTQSTTGTLDATGVGENAKPIGFFPFHDYDSTHNLNVNQNSNLNHHLGMSMNLQFDIPQDKQINGEDIVFEFSGDDDLWVFVDGKLVLDMGGIHQPVPGTINFSGTSNNVTVYGQNPKSVTFTPGYHTMEVFYLERGGCDSNCSIMFNMPLVIGRGDFKVVKKGEKETEDVTLGGAVFGLWETEDCLGNPVRQATSGNNGLVEFNNLSVKNPGQIYYMKEITAPNGYIKRKKIYTVTASNSPGADGKYTFTIREKDSPKPLDTIVQEPHTPIVYNLKQKPRNISLQKTWQNEYGENITAPSGATATFKLHKKGYYSAGSTTERTLYKVQLQNLSGSTLAQGFFYEGDRIRLKYEFDNSPIHTTISKNNVYYADLIKENGDTGPRYVEYTVSASDADADNQIVFKRENDASGHSHGFKTKEWELVEAAPVPSTSASGMEDRILETFNLPYQGQWSRTFSNLDTYDAEGNPFMYWFEETGTNHAEGYFPVTVVNADHPLDVGQSMQEIKNLKKAAIKIVKVTKGTETGIQGAKFSLTQVDDEGHAVPGGIVKPEVSTDGNGIIIFDNLEPGRYVLAETKVPDGYIRNEGPYYIIVNNDYTTTLDISVAHTLITKAESSSVYTVQNEPGTALPNTGGSGTNLFYCLGIMLTGFAFSGFVMRGR